MISCPKNGISRDLFASLNAIISLRDFTGARAPSDARYALRSALNSYRSTSYSVSSHFGDGFVDEIIGWIAVTEEPISCHADARTFERVSIQEYRVIGRGR